jgi:RNA polymerase sigma factor (sigma-70 family)
LTPKDKSSKPIKPENDYNLDVSFYLKEATKHKLLTKEEESSLARRTKGTGEAARQAKEEFFLRNMRLVVAAARRFGRTGSPQVDLIQEGSIGLMRAIEKYDPEKGFRFSTYASWWIRQAILRYAYSYEEIRLPGHVSSSRNLLNRILRDYPGITDQEIIQKTGFSPKFLEVLKALPRVDSLEESLFEGSEFSLGESIPDESQEPMDKTFQKTQLVHVLEQALKEVPERDREIYWSWSLEGETLQTIAVRWGITRERVRQIVVSTNNKVRVFVGEAPIRSSKKGLP